MPIVSIDGKMGKLKVRDEKIGKRQNEMLEERDGEIRK